VKSNLLSGVGPRVKYVVVNSWVRDGEEEVVAVTLIGPRTHNKGLMPSIDDGPRAEKKMFIQPQGYGVPGKKPGESASFWDQCEREPRQGSSSLVGIFLREGEYPAQPGGVALRSDVGDDIGDLTWHLGRSRDMVNLLKAK